MISSKVRPSSVLMVQSSWPARRVMSSPWIPWLVKCRMHSPHQETPPPGLPRAMTLKKAAHILMVSISFLIFIFILSLWSTYHITGTFFIGRSDYIIRAIDGRNGSERYALFFLTSFPPPPCCLSLPPHFVSIILPSPPISSTFWNHVNSHYIDGIWVSVNSYQQSRP